MIKYGLMKIDSDRTDRTKVNIKDIVSLGGKNQKQDLAYRYSS